MTIMQIQCQHGATGEALRAEDPPNTEEFKKWWGDDSTINITPILKEHKGRVYVVTHKLINTPDNTCCEGWYTEEHFWRTITIITPARAFEPGDLVKRKKADIEDADLTVSFIFTVTSYNQQRNIIQLEEHDNESEDASLYEFCVTQKR
jgi:hypothetical protein